jgi:hypothetical protein
VRKKSPGLLILFSTLVFGFHTTRVALAKGSVLDDMLKNVASSGGRLVADAVFRAAANYVFKNHCGAASHDVDQLICGALGSFTGADEKAWKDNVTSELAGIRTDLARLEQGQARIQADVRDLVAGNKVLLSKVSALVNETVAQTGIREIQSLWDVQFETLFNSESRFSREQLLSFADQIVRVQQMHTKLGVISRTLTTNGIGGADPLLLAWARTLNTQLAANPGKADLEIAYTFLEQNFADLLFEQRRGFLMYVWAAQILESDCEIRATRATRGEEICTRAPMSGADFQEAFDKQVAKQLETFNDGVEWLVLANSDAHSDKAAFLHDDAQWVFRRLDLFSAANEQSFGLRGRVISMGDAFDGKLTVEGETMPQGRTSLIPTAGGSLDWWRATNANWPEVYDEVRFANQWRVLHYQKPDVVERTARITAPRLVHLEPFAVARIDLLTGEVTKAPLSPTVKLFASFTAIERAGGGFALASGGWNADRPPGVSERGFVDIHDQHFQSSAGSGKPFLYAIAESRGRITKDPLTFLSTSQRPFYKTAQRASAKTKKEIRYVPGGELRLNIDPISGFTGFGGGRSVDYAPPSVAVGLKTTFKRGGIDPKPAELEGRAALVFGPAGSDNGFVHAKKLTTGSPETVHIDWTARSVLVTLESGKSYPLTLETAVSIYQETSGWNATEYALIARAKFSNVYLTEN